MLEIYYNGVWNEWKPAGMQKFDFIAHTTLSDWELTNVNMTYSVDIIEKILFDSTNINSSASTATGQENCRATCKTPIMIKKGDKLKLTGTGNTSTGGNWLTISASTDGVNFNIGIIGNLYTSYSEEYDLDTYAGMELYFRVGMRNATTDVNHTFTKFEISQ